MGLERQQLKWLALSAVVALVVFGCLLALGTVVDLDHGTGQVAAGAILAMVFATPPIVSV